MVAKMRKKISILYKKILSNLFHNFKLLCFFAISRTLLFMKLETVHFVPSTFFQLCFFLPPPLECIVIIINLAQVFRIIWICYTWFVSALHWLHFFFSIRRKYVDDLGILPHMRNLGSSKHMCFSEKSRFILRSLFNHVDEFSGVFFSFNLFAENSIFKTFNIPFFFGVRILRSWLKKNGPTYLPREIWYTRRIYFGISLR